MRPALCFLLTLLLLAGFRPALAQSDAYLSDFSKDLDGWYPRSAGAASLERQGDGIAIAGRKADWHSPGRDFVLVPGRQYEISVLVYQDAAASAAFMISIAHTIHGEESYENLARLEVRRGEWTRLSAKYIAGNYERFVLYVETLGAPTLPFQMRDFSLATLSGSYPMDLPSLKTLYADYFDFGCAVTGREAMNPQLMAFYATQFNIMTPGNELKPDFVLDIARSKALSKADQSQVAIRLDPAKPLLDYAQAQGIKVHGHVLVWHSQTPDAFFREGYSSTGPYLSRDMMLARLDNYIRLVFEETQRLYPGLIVSWDVVNEAVDDQTGALRSSSWTKVVGEDFVSQAFRIARKYAPAGTALYYNDYSTPYQPKLNGILRLLETLVGEGSIDGYGLQCHYQLGTPTLAQIQNAMDKIIALDLTLRMSEMDILIDANTPENLEKQAERYGDILALFRQYKDHIAAVHTWGVTDNFSWKASQYPLLFDAKGQPKPAFHAITAPLR
ncbi:MAG: endo-1,4-beta-xylanase [Christensenellales bacterium]